MRHSDTLTMLATALAAAQFEIKGATKDSVNPHYKNRYADLASVMDACLPALNRNGIAVIQPYVEIDGQRAVKTILAHESGETLETAVPLPVPGRPERSAVSARRRCSASACSRARCSARRFCSASRAWRARVASMVRSSLARRACSC